MDAPSPHPTWRPDALAYPWAARPNPATVATARATERWVTAHGLLDDEVVAARYRAVSVAALAGLTHPLAEPALLELIAAMMGWIFIEDDRYDLADGSGRAGQLAGRFDGWLDVLATRRVPAGADPATQALAELAERLAARGSARWYARFVATMRRFWHEGVVVETWYRDHGLTPDPASYMATRVQTVGVHICLAMVELERGELDEALVGNPILARMTWLASRIIAYVNDLFSYEKERRAADPNNFVHAVCCYEGLDLRGAFARTVQAHDRELEQFVQLERAVRRSTPALALQLQPQLDGCKAWMAGALQWQRTAARYEGGRELLERPTEPTASPSLLLPSPIREESDHGHGHPTAA